MPGVSLGTIVEIFRNPHDLQIAVYQKNREEKYAYHIARGPTENFKPLVTWEPEFATLEEAVQEIERFLHALRHAAEEEVGGHRSILTLINSADRKTREVRVLSHDVIEQICRDLRTHEIANTYTYETTATQESRIREMNPPARSARRGIFTNSRASSGPSS